MMEMVYYQVERPSYQNLLKELEADIQHANALVAAIPKPKGGVCIHMKLVYNQLSPLFFFLLQWLDGSCCSSFFPFYFNLFHILIYEVYPDGRTHRSTQGRKATVREFYAIILASLKRLHDDLVAQERTSSLTKKSEEKEKLIRHGMLQNTIDEEREEECGICLVPTTKIVLPGCCHAMCINCYRNWNTRSKSCPFCRGGLRRVKSEDLWVLTSESEVIDSETISREEISRFYLYIQSLPKAKDYPDSPFWVHYDYLI